MEAEKSTSKAGAIHRIISFWIDVFVIYCITRACLALLPAFSLYSPFGTVFLLVGATYDTVMLICFRQTIGHKLSNTTIVTVHDQRPSVKQLITSKWIGKWGMTFGLPLIVAPHLVELVWFSTIFDSIVVLTILLTLTLHYAIFKRCWHEQIAGIKTIRQRDKSAQKSGFKSLIAMLVLLLLTSASEFIITDRLPARLGLFQSSKSSRNLDAFLESQNRSAVDYVLDLFDSHELVVLCERGHPEMTQYDFIHDLISHPEFATKVGNVFSELGQIGKQEDLQLFMDTKGLSEDQIRERSMDLIRNFGVWPEWTNSNMFHYFQRLYNLNQKKIPEERVHHFFTDAPLQWQTINTPEDYESFMAQYEYGRDHYMAGTILEKISTLKDAGKKHKGLVIMNYRHAMDFTGRDSSVERKNTFEFLKDSLGDQVVNVLLNNRVVSSIPIASGLWDRAFRKQNQPIGFNLDGTPFGNTRFDMFPFPMLFSIFEGNELPIASGNLNYQDVFHGYAYTHPTDKQYFDSYVPGYFDGFEEEFLRRTALISKDYRLEASKILKNYEIDKNPYRTNRPFDYQIETKITLCFSLIFWVGFLLACIMFLRGTRMRKNPIQ